MMSNLDMLHCIDGAIAGAAAGEHAEMVRRVTDLFLVGADRCSEEEIAAFDGVFTRLVAEIEIAARALLADRLAPIPNAPPNIIRVLAGDEAIEVAGPVLSQSERLDDVVLIDTAKTKSQEHLFSISRRPQLTEAVTDVLVQRGDRLVLLSAVGNSGARFSDSGFETLVRRAEGDDKLATSVAARPELPRPLFVTLLDQASQAVREKLQAEYPQATHEVNSAVAEAVESIRAETLDAEGSEAIRRHAEKREQWRQRTDETLRSLAQAGHFEEAAAALASVCSLPRSFVERAMTVERADTVVVMAKAAGLSWPTARALLSMPARRGSISTGKLAQCQATFDRLNPVTARDMVRFYGLREQAGLRTARAN